MPSETTEAEQSLRHLAERFEHWRQTRAHAHERIPLPLWEQAIALSRVLPDAQVAKRLRLSQTDLKRRRAREHAPSPSSETQAREQPAAFVELPAARAWPAGSSEPMLVEFERSDGARMRLRYGQAPPLGALVQAFLDRL